MENQFLVIQSIYRINENKSTKDTPKDTRFTWKTREQEKTTKSHHQEIYYERKTKENI